MTARAAAPPSATVVLGVAGDERVAGFDAALRRAGLPAARLLDYRDLLRDPSRLTEAFAGDADEAALGEAALGEGALGEGALGEGAGGGALRIESPGGGAALSRALARFGAHLDGDGLPEPQDADEGADDAARIRPGAPVHRGIVAAVRMACALKPASAVATHDPDAVALFYDKRRCHAAMAAAGFPVPRALPPARGFEELLSAMREAGMGRVFVKPRFGSGAVGVVALAVSGGGVVAVSAAEPVPGADPAGGTVLRHSGRLRARRGAEAGALVDAVLAQDAHVERWVPKAALAGRPCDLRLLTVGGEPAHAVVRTAEGPITNLDLGARRAEAGALRAVVRPRAWDAMLDDARRFAALFPASFLIAFDLCFAVGGRRHAFLEVNAFGDLLRRTRHDGLDPYELQVARFPAWAARRREAARREAARGDAAPACAAVPA